MESLPSHLLSILRSPKDQTLLKLENSTLVSEAGDRYPIVDGIPSFELPWKPDTSTLDLTVLILTLNEEGNIERVVADVVTEIKKHDLSFEVLVVDGGSKDRTREMAAASGAKVIDQRGSGYAEGLLQGFRAAQGRYLITLDGDLSHPASLIPELLRRRDDAELIIGSRWMAGGGFEGPILRMLLSRTLNVVFRRALSLPVSDLSSGYRLYRSSILCSDEYTSEDFSVLEELLVKAYIDGHRITEVPLVFKRRQHGSSHVRLFKFARSYVLTLLKMWMLRNQANGCDYDHRAYDTWLIPQRYWQRKRFRNVMALLGEFRSRGSVLDIGCGSSRIIQAMPHAIAFDLSLRKLRFLRATNPLRVSGSALALPFKDSSFDCVLHSQLIEHLPPEASIFSELQRVIKPGGTLIMGTVDYSSWTWPLIERIYEILLPHAYAGEHITHYSLDSLKERLREFGFAPRAVKTILKGEITVLAQRE